MFEITITDDTGREYTLELDYYQFRDFCDWAEDHDLDFDVEYIG